MTTHVVSDEQLGHVARRQHELFRRVRDGSTSIDSVLTGLQKLIEGGNEVRVPKSPTSETVYTLRVNYSLRPTDDFREDFLYISDGYKRGDWERHASCKDLPQEGEYDVTFLLVNFVRSMTNEMVLKELDAKCLRPATLEECICFARNNPDLQRLFPIAVLGSFCFWRGDRNIPYLDISNYTRQLSLKRTVADWTSGWRFLAVSKVVSV